MRWLVLAGMAALVIASFLVAPAKNFPQPDLARVVFFHLPAAFTTVVFVVFAALCSWRYLATRKMVWEHRSYAANDMAFTMAIVTMLTGIYFSQVQWGDWWHWDPRQTSFLIVLILQGAYFGLRMAFEEETTRARAAATYSSLTLLPVLFLFFVFPRLPQVLKQSLHPSTTIQSGGFSADYWSVVLGVFALLLGTCFWLYRAHVRCSVIENALRDNNGNLEDSGNPATARRVDRVVPVRK